MSKQDFWSRDLKAASEANAPAKTKEDLENRGKEASTAASIQSAASSAAAQKRERAEFILKYGIPPEDVTAAKNIPGDPSKTGEEYLATIKDKGMVNRIRMLAEGRMSWPKGAALRNPAMAELIAAASIYDPTLDEANAATRYGTRKDFTSGVSARNLTALNTAVGHLASLKKYAAQLNNTFSPKINAPINYLQYEWLGDPRVKKFKTTAMAFSAELAKVFKGTASPGVTEIKDWEKQVNENMSPEQMQGFIETAADLLNSRIEAVGDQYNRGMGKSSDPVRLLSPHAQELYRTLERPLAENNTADVLAGPEEGRRVAGEDIKGWRLSPESEAAVVDYARQPDATPEGYAALLADKAIAEGHLPPSQREDYVQRTAEGTRDFFTLPPEERAKVNNVDYSQVDKAATENAGLVEGVAQTARNLPESAYNITTGLLAPGTDLLKSAVSGEREGLYKLIPDLVMGDEETRKNLGNALNQRYGSLDAIKRTAITDPLGFAGDVSIPLTLGGVAAERLPGLMSKYGTRMEATGRFFDPLSAMVGAATEAVPSAFSALKNKYTKGRIGETAADLTSEAVGLPSGVGGPALREGFEAGRSKGRAGEATPQSEAFTANMRNPTENVSSTVDLARQAVENLRQQASARYRAQMAQFGKEPTLLSPDNLRQTMADMRPKNYDAMLDAPHRPSDHVAWQQMNDTVEHYLAKAAQDPSLLEPLAVDQFKQDLYSIGSKIGGATDRDAARIAGNTYRSVRKMLTDHDPVYAEIMKPYADAAQEAASLESGFSLASSRGKPVNIDAATRRLQSIFRNNANTNYGQRAAQGERLAALDTTGTLMPSLGGQTASSWTPRGIRAGIEGAGAAGLLLHGGPMAFLDPSILAALASTSPRVAGEVSYGAGRLAGAGERIGKEAVNKALDLYDKYPTTALGVSRASSYADETEEERRRRLREKYNLNVPELPPEVAAYLGD